MADRFLSVPEAAKTAFVSPSLIYLWTSVERRLPHIRAGGRGRRGKILINERDLSAFMASLRVEGGSETPTPAPATTTTPRFRHLNL